MDTVFAHSLCKQHGRLLVCLPGLVGLAPAMPGQEHVRAACHVFHVAPEEAQQKVYVACILGQAMRDEVHLCVARFHDARLE